MNFKPTLPGALPPPPSTAPKSNAHVHLHAHGGKRPARKGAEPGEAGHHEESYSDKVESQLPGAERRQSALPTPPRPMAPSVASRPATTSASLQRAVQGRPNNPGQGEAQLKAQATQAKQKLSALLHRLTLAPGSLAASGAMAGLERKVQLGAALASQSPHGAAAQVPLQRLDTLVKLGELLDRGSPHLEAAREVIERTARRMEA